MATSVRPLDAQSIIWNCLNGERSMRSDQVLRDENFGWAGPPDPDPDVISLRDVLVVDIVDGHQGASCVRSSHIDSTDTDAVSKWLRKLADQGTSLGTERTHLRLLIGSQVAQNDALRPPASLQGMTLSNSLLAKELRIPAIAAEKLGQEVSHATTYPRLPGVSAVECHSIVTAMCSASWSYDSSAGVNSVFIVLRNACKRIAGERVSRLLELLKDFAYLPTFIPYILLDLDVDYLTSTVSYVEQHSIDDHRQILMGLAKKRRLEMFTDAASRLQSTSHALKHADCVMSMIETAINNGVQRHAGMSDDEWTKMQEHHQSLQKLIEFKLQELKQLVAHSKFQQAEAVNLQTEVMGLMSFNQQEISQLIAERTKADGTSMKTLAVIAALYLPTTAIAAVFSMPLFSWNTNLSDSTVVNPRLWIFFAFAIPLTLVTMAFFWAWVKYENEGPEFKRRMPALSDCFRLKSKPPRRRKPQKHIV